MNFETAWIHFIMDAFGSTILVVVAFKLPIVDRVDGRKICFFHLWVTEGIRNGLSW